MYTRYEIPFLPTRDDIRQLQQKTKVKPLLFFLLYATYVFLHKLLRLIICRYQQPCSAGVGSRMFVMRIISVYLRKVITGNAIHKLRNDFRIIVTGSIMVKY